MQPRPHDSSATPVRKLILPDPLQGFAIYHLSLCEWRSHCPVSVGPADILHINRAPPRVRVTKLPKVFDHLLEQFRIASLATQAILMRVIGARPGEDPALGL